ncbi:hypothetical protein CIHG_06816 [Coccidioides immitis H538.4]|uniref:Uncharacterized protein n=2 Tax=Coccidioides immitis TaxID=5501 RepID=A0A0J8RV07_COCIT|nr:hypothetical protein CIRG_04366 [Coccidioides immitis RMSCC 2394]KMU89015.1 hypothetical protein CIHG_06816 [Coccidioides immitis H538.4]
MAPTIVLRPRSSDEENSSEVLRYSAPQNQVGGGDVQKKENPPFGRRLAGAKKICRMPTNGHHVYLQTTKGKSSSHRLQRYHAGGSSGHSDAANSRVPIGAHLLITVLACLPRIYAHLLDVNSNREQVQARSSRHPPGAIYRNSTMTMGGSVFRIACGLQGAYQ